MAETLSAFLSQNAKKVPNKKIAVSDRFVGPEGKPVEWEIRCIPASENQKLRKNSIRNVPIGNRGQYSQVLDNAAYQSALAAHCVVFPDLNSADLQDSYDVRSAEALIAAMLTPAEFDGLILAILEHCGFKDDGELVDEAKN